MYDFWGKGDHKWWDTYAFKSKGNHKRWDPMIVLNKIHIHEVSWYTTWPTYTSEKHKGKICSNNISQKYDW